MERYHIFKLGLAILFYAVYCIRPMMVNGLKTNEATDNHTKKLSENDYVVFYQGVQGKPGVDFPVLSHIPRTTFNCKGVDSGYYADLDTDCQVFHICADGKKISFLCPNGTIFQQAELICEWWFKVNCSNSPNLYEESAEQLREDNARRKASRLVKENMRSNTNHGAIMRTEEHSTVSASQNGRNLLLKSEPNTKTDTPIIRIKQGNRRNDQSRVLVTNQNSRQKPNSNSGDAKNFGNINNNGNRQNNYYNTKNSAESVQKNTNHERNLQRFDKKSRRINFQLSTSLNQLPIVSNENFNENSKLNNSDVTFVRIQPASRTKTISISNRKSPTSTKNLDKPNNQESPKNQVVVSLSRNDITNRRLEPTESEETQIPQETASFYKNTFNSIQQSYKPTSPNPYPNHRSTYSDIKEPKYYQTKTFNSISSVTPQYLTTQPINSGKPFVGSQVGVNLQNSRVNNFDYTNKIATTTQSSLVRDESINLGNPNQSEAEPAKISVAIQEPNGLFNVGQGDQQVVSPAIYTKPPIARSKGLTAPPIGSFNLGSELTTVPYTEETTPYSSPITLPTELFNVGRTDNPIITSPKYSTKAPIVRNQNVVIPAAGSFNYGLSTTRAPFFETTTTRKIVDHATVYGRFVPAATPTPLVKPRFRIDNPNSISSTDKNCQTTTSKSDGAYFVTKSPNFEAFTTTTEIPNVYDNIKAAELLKPRPFQIQVAKPKSGLNPKIEIDDSIKPSYPTYKVSSASPFTPPTPGEGDNFTPEPTLPTTLRTSFDNIDNMIDALVEMANPNREKARPGLVVPPSAGPQTLHSLAVYFANALDGLKENPNIDLEENKNLTENEIEKKRLTALLTQMTMSRYKELFNKNTEEEENDETTTVTSNLDLEGQHSKNLVGDNSPKVRQLAKVFTQALSSYLDDPETFKRVLQEVRPTEPPELDENPTEGDPNEEELLNFSDADSKSSYPPIFPTLPSLRPTWGYLVAFNTSQFQSNSELDGKNSLNPEENLQLADSQSFVSQYNNLKYKEPTIGKTTERSKELPEDHWTASPGATKLWASAFGFNPETINNNFETTETPASTPLFGDELATEVEATILPDEPHHEINYELRALPNLALNSTQVHGILIDFMNTSKSGGENSKLERILRKLNTTQEDFLAKMKEIEANPLTRRLILLLISECGVNATKEINTQAVPLNGILSNGEILQTSSSSFQGQPYEKLQQQQSDFQRIVDPRLKDEDQDSRALQLLNSLYSIASRFGK